MVPVGTGRGGKGDSNAKKSRRWLPGTPHTWALAVVGGTQGTVAPGSSEAIRRPPLRAEGCSFLKIVNYFQF